MPLVSGQKLGPYELSGALGAGGMGEVYRARDTRLGRDVAIKVLPKEMSADPHGVVAGRNTNRVFGKPTRSHESLLQAVGWNG